MMSRGRPESESLPSFIEMFAGGGMARAGLGPGWRCRLAVDLDPGKAAAYRENWGEREFRLADVTALRAAEIPTADLAWASFPCQDLSLAGRGAGLAGNRSGTVFAFAARIAEMAAEGRGPALVVLENVVGLLGAHEGRDFAALIEAMARMGCGQVGALVLDAADFVPQSRPRLFLVGLRAGVAAPAACVSEAPDARLHPPALRRAVARLPGPLAARHAWWRLAPPPPRRATLADILEPDETPDLGWFAEARAERLLALAGPRHRAAIEAAVASGARHVGALCRRTRVEDGVKRQRIEIRFDGLAGCLRTPGGGSSLPLLAVVDRGRLRLRPISPREGARLMGLPETWRLPASRSAAFEVLGDGLAVPVVQRLAAALLEPLAAAAKTRQARVVAGLDLNREPEGADALRRT